MAWVDALPYVIVLAGYVIFGITGFGSALVIVPLLSWHWPLAKVVPVVLLLDVLATGHIGLRHRAQVQWRELARLAPTVLLGAAAGVWLGRQSQVDALQAGAPEAVGTSGPNTLASARWLASQDQLRPFRIQVQVSWLPVER